MALTLGTNVGFVLTAPTADPAGTGVTSDGSSFVTKDTAPAGAVKIVEVGWYKESGTTSSNTQVGLYADSSGTAGTRLQVTGDQASGTSAGWIVFTGLNWPVTAGTAYWLGMQQDAHTGSSGIDSAASGGSGIDTRTSQSALTNPYGGGAVSDADGMYSIYAVYQTAPTTALNTPTDTATGQSTTPALNFTGTDADGNLEYNVQVHTSNTFPLNYGNGLTLNGSSQYAGRAIVSTATDNLSIMCWAKMTSLPASGKNGVFFDNGASDGNGYLIQVNDAGHFNLDLSFVANLDSGYTMSTGTWYHLAAIRNGGVWQCYVNGTAQGSTISNSPNSPSDWLTIGAQRIASGTADDFFNGIIDDVRMYTRAVTPTELLTLYNNASDPYSSDISTTGLVSWYKLDEANGTNCDDSSASAADATTSGSPSFGTGIVATSSASLINAFSATDAGFTAGHPFASGAAKDYTVQSALNNSTTYYWRARAKDTTGSNRYGAWPTAFSFTTAAAGNYPKINIGDVWKQSTAIKINIGDTWKSVTSVKINIGDSWKTIFMFIFSFLWKKFLP